MTEETRAVRDEVEWFLEMEHVNVARGATVVLQDISLRIRRGEQIVILGPNGCGKSTLIKTMTRECYPMMEPGMVMRLFGWDRWVVADLRQHFGVVEANLPGERTPLTNGLDAVVSGLLGSSTLWPNLTVTAEMYGRAEAAMQLLDAGYLKDKLVGQMSAGEQRRVMIARALVNEPEMLLLDEPSNALDLAAQSELREALEAVTARGVGLMLVTHHIGDILPSVERVLMMREGRIFADGSKRELLTRGKLRELFGVEVEMAERNGFFHAW